MITSKHLFIGIVLLGISIFCTAQEVKIEFSYDKPNNSLTLILTNNIDKEILVMNQGRLSEFSGSYIVLTESSNGKSADLTICLFTLESGKWILHKSLSPKGRIELSYPLDSIPANNVVRAHLFLSTYSNDEKTGKPVEGAYLDVNGDGQINSSDLYRYHSPAPDYILGFSTSLRWKKWTLSTSLRANIGNYVYNAMAMNAGAWETVSYNSYQLNNLSTSYLKTGFQTRQYLSDYYVENASFLKMDNLSLNYNFGQICKGCSLNVSAMVQNVFCITKYSGVDPEVPNGVDNSFYPRPRTFSLNVGFNF